jgi:hypothetical protein
MLVHASAYFAYQPRSPRQRPRPLFFQFAVFDQLKLVNFKFVTADVTQVQLTEIRTGDLERLPTLLEFWGKTKDRKPPSYSIASCFECIKNAR